MRWVRTIISSIYYFTEIPIIFKQHARSDWINNEPRKPWWDVLRTLSEHGYSKLWRTSLYMSKLTTWWKSERVGRISAVTALSLMNRDRWSDGQGETNIPTTPPTQKIVVWGYDWWQLYFPNRAIGNVYLTVSVDIRLQYVPRMCCCLASRLNYLPYGLYGSQLAT